VLKGRDTAKKLTVTIFKHDAKGNLFVELCLEGLRDREGERGRRSEG